MIAVVETTAARRHAKLQSNHHHQQTNVQHFTGRMDFPSPNQQCQGRTDNLQIRRQRAGWFRVVNETAHDVVVARCSDVAETIPHHHALHLRQTAPDHRNVCTNSTESISVLKCNHNQLDTLIWITWREPETANP